MTAWNYKDKPSHNFDSRAGHTIDMLVLHYTGMKTPEAAIERLCDRESKVSAHYVVDMDGSVLRLVDEDRRAWHAGLSFWRGHTNINQRSIGIEIVNAGHKHGYHPFPAAQMKMVAMLCKDILARTPTISPCNVVGHSDVAPTRKEDPGELFNWKALAGLRVGLWPKADDGWRMADDEAKMDSSSVIRHLSSYGYDISNLPKAITAFQRHFRPANMDGIWDVECASLLAALLAML